MEYDECNPSTSGDGEDEMWYYLCEENYSHRPNFTYYHLDNNITTIRYFIEDDGTGYIPVESNYTIKYSDIDNGTFHLELADVLCPYPWYQYYTWSTYVPCQYEDIIVTNDMWGNYIVSGPGTFDLTGQFYIYNTVYITVVVIIHVIVMDN